MCESNNDINFHVECHYIIIVRECLVLKLRYVLEIPKSKAMHSLIVYQKAYSLRNVKTFSKNYDQC